MIASLTGFGDIDLPDGWPVRRLGTMVAQRHGTIEVVGGKDYRLLGVRWYGWGAFHRETVTAETSEAKVLQPVYAGDLIYNRLFAWKGSFGIVAEELDGAFASGEFPLFRARSDCDIRYVKHYLCQPGLWQYIAEVSTGATKTSRNRWKEPRLRELRVPCPPLDVQTSIADALDLVTNRAADVVREIGVDQIPTPQSLTHYVVEERDALVTSAVLGHVTPESVQAGREMTRA